MKKKGVVITGKTERRRDAKTQIAKTARFHHVGKERQIMSNILLAIIALLLVSIWQQLKEINERRKGDMDGEKEKKGNAEFGNRK